MSEETPDTNPKQLKKLKDRLIKKVVEDFVANAKKLMTEEEYKDRLRELEDLSEEEREEILSLQPLMLKSELTPEMILEFALEDMIKTTYQSSSITTKQKGYEMLLKPFFGEDFSLGGKTAKEELETEEISPVSLPFSLNIKEKQSK
jgi:hypothetical protein